MRGSQYGTDGAAVLEPPDGVNLYRYCGNDPINLADPSGLIDFSVETADFVSRMPEGVWEQFVRRHGLPAVQQLNQAHADGWRFEFRAELWNAYEVDRSTRTVSIDLDNGVFFDAPAGPQEMVDALNTVLNEREEDGRQTLRPPSTGQNGTALGSKGTAWDESVTQHEALAMASAKSLDFLYDVRNDLALAAIGGGLGRLRNADDLIEAGNKARATRRAKELGEPYVVFNKTHSGSRPVPKGFGPNGGRLQSHHTLQQEWAIQNLKGHGYDPKLAPTITIETGKEFPHTLLSNLQNERRSARVASGKGKWSSTVDEEIAFIVSDFRQAGFSDDIIKQVLEQNYRMLDKLGVAYTRPPGF